MLASRPRKGTRVRRHFLWPLHLLDFLADQHRGDLRPAWGRRGRQPMVMARRRIRSAGRTSGSIEITLPPELAVLEGMYCRILLRDGARPEIVLQPELTPAVAAFHRVWERLRSLLSLAGDIGEFPVQECEVLLFPAQQRGRPLLAYSQAWQVSKVASSAAVKGASLAGDASEAVSAVIAPLAMVAGQRLGLSAEVAAAFGPVLGRLATPAGSAAAGLQSFEQGAALRIWRESFGAGPAILDMFGPQMDEAQARQALKRVVSLFRQLQECPDKHELHRAHWREDPLVQPSC